MDKRPGVASLYPEETVRTHSLFDFNICVNCYVLIVLLLAVVVHSMLTQAFRTAGKHTRGSSRWDESSFRKKHPHESEFMFMKMIRADSEKKEPLVIKHKHKRHFFVFRMSKHAWLEIKPEVVESLEAIISKFLSTLRKI